MPASGIAVVSLRLRSQFLDGLTPTDRDTILAAATLRGFAANLVITNQGNPADHFFLLTKGLARFSSLKKRARNLSVVWARRSIRCSHHLSDTSSYLFSTETVTNSSVLV